MQFLPGTWSRYASDGDGDGKADVQNVYDATLAAARYLCSGGLNLRDQSQVLTAILRYNNSMAYAQNVLGWAAAYATGVVPVDLPPIIGPVPPIGDAHLDASPEGLGPGMPLNATGLPADRSRWSHAAAGSEPARHHAGTGRAAARSAPHAQATAGHAARTAGAVRPPQQNCAGVLPAPTRQPAAAPAARGAAAGPPAPPPPPASGPSAPAPRRAGARLRRCRRRPTARCPDRPPDAAAYTRGRCPSNRR